MNIKGDGEVLFFIKQGDRQADGGVSSISNVIENLNGIRCHVVTTSETPQTRAWRKNGISVTVFSFDHYHEQEGRGSQFVALARSNLQAYRIVRAVDPSVVHVNDRTAFRGCGVGARLAGVLLVNNVRDTQPRLHGVRRVKWLVELTLSTRILTLSREMIEYWERSLRLRFLPKWYRTALRNRFEYIYSIVDTERFRPVSEQRRMEIRRSLDIYGEPLLAYVASFHPKKAQLSFIKEALPPLVHEHPKMTVVFVGDFKPSQDDHARSCKRAIASLDLEENVTFAGYQSNVEQWYQASDLTVLASEKEGLARTMIESIACGTPVVSFDVASAHEILTQHQCGIVVSQSEYNAFVDAVTALWEDENRRDELGSNGVRVAREMFNPETIANQYERLYENVARGS